MHNIFYIYYHCSKQVEHDCPEPYIYENMRFGFKILERGFYQVIKRCLRLPGHIGAYSVWG